MYASFDLEEDRYIRAIQTKPADNKARLVVHHTNAFAIAPGDTTEGVESERHLVEYASGKQAEIYPSDSGVLLQAGSQTRLSYHLHSVGEDIDTVIEMGIVLHPQGTVPKHVRWTKQLAGAHGTIAGLVDLPPGQVTRSDGYTRFGKAARITMFQPHMHMLGKYQCLELIYPTQPVTSEMVNCANFDYNWHLAYNYADDSAPLVPPGTILHVINWHDNTAAHRANPDPRNWTGNGGRTIDEMGFAWIGWYDLTDEEYEAELAEREGGPAQDELARSAAGHGAPRRSDAMRTPSARTGAGCLLGLALSLVLPASASGQADPFNFPFSSGQTVAPFFDGWSPNPDGTFEMHFGYINRNHVEEVHVAIGPDNQMEAGSADQGQPTFFYPRVHRRVFSVTVPADFGDQELVWSLTVRGQRQQAIAWLDAVWEIEPILGGREPPRISGTTASRPWRSPRRFARSRCRIRWR